MSDQTIVVNEVIAGGDTSAMSWKAVIAGATVSIAVSMLMIAFGIGVGFSVISPWSDQGVSATAFTIGAGIYLIVVAMISSTIGGYLAGRLRSGWTAVHEHERFFRDSAHGVTVWALATVVSAAVLGSAFTHILAGVGAGAAPAATAAVQSAPTDMYVDRLLRAQPMPGKPAESNPVTTPAPADQQTQAPLQGGQIAPTPPMPRNATGAVGDDRNEVARILGPALVKGGSIPADDRTYLARLISARTGLPQAEAEARVSDVITQAKAAADKARKSVAAFSLWLVVSMLAGALSAALAAIEGGNLRNREWYLPAGMRTRAVPAE